MAAAFESTPETKRNANRPIENEPKKVIIAAKKW
jgi:hypothetical protein